MCTFRSCVINNTSETVALMKLILIEKQLGIVSFQCMCSKLTLVSITKFYLQNEAPL